MRRFICIFTERTDSRDCKWRRKSRMRREKGCILYSRNARMVLTHFAAVCMDCIRTVVRVHLNEIAKGNDLRIWMLTRKICYSKIGSRYFTETRKLVLYLIVSKQVCMKYPLQV